MSEPLDRFDVALLVLCAALAWHYDDPMPLVVGALLIVFVSPLLQWAGAALGSRVARRSDQVNLK